MTPISAHALCWIRAAVYLSPYNLLFLTLTTISWHKFINVLNFKYGLVSHIIAAGIIQTLILASERVTPRKEKPGTEQRIKCPNGINIYVLITFGDTDPIFVFKTILPKVKSVLLTLTPLRLKLNLRTTRMCQDTAHAFTPSHSQTHNKQYLYNPRVLLKFNLI